MGPYRAKFLLESVADLKQRLRDIGSDLFVSVGKPEDVIPSRQFVVYPFAACCDV